MTALSDFCRPGFAQWGGDGVIGEICRRLEISEGTAVEFGAGNGRDCSQTAMLAQQGWPVLLIEADPLLAAHARRNTAHEKVTVINATVEPSGPSTIDAHLQATKFGCPTFMSVDVDGDDYWIVCSMTARPRILCVEFNPTVPPHLHIEPSGPANRFGVGPATLKTAGEQRGYTMIGVAGANMWFVDTADAGRFADLETDLTVLLPPAGFMFVATDYGGRMIALGPRPPFGLAWPPSPTVFVPGQPSLLPVDCDDIGGRTFRAMMERFDRIEGCSDDDVCGGRRGRRNRRSPGGPTVSGRPPGGRF